jgi:hypothetical protein
LGGHAPRRWRPECPPVHRIRRSGRPDRSAGSRFEPRGLTRARRGAAAIRRSDLPPCTRWTHLPKFGLVLLKTLHAESETQEEQPILRLPPAGAHSRCKKQQAGYLLELSSNNGVGASYRALQPRSSPDFTTAVVRRRDWRVRRARVRYSCSANRAPDTPDTGECRQVRNFATVEVWKRTGPSTIHNAAVAASGFTGRRRLCIRWTHPPKFGLVLLKTLHPESETPDERPISKLPSAGAHSRCKSSRPAGGRHLERAPRMRA